MNELLLIAGMVLATVATRIPVLVWLSRRQLPTGLSRALKYVPVAVLAAIIAPAALVFNGALAINVENAAIPASLLAIFAAWRTRNLLLTIVLGMAAFFVWRAIFS